MTAAEFQAIMEMGIEGFTGTLCAVLIWWAILTG
jgi:hypothetical protein